MKKFLTLLFLSFNLVVYSQQQTRVVDRIYDSNGEFLSVWHICENNNVADQIIKNTTSFPEDAIKLGWDSGYRISDISYGSGYWSLVMDKGKDFGKQRWFTRSSTEDMENTIQEGWDEGFRIQDISYGDGVFAIVMSEVPPHGTGGQTWFTRSTVDNFTETVDEYWEEGYRIIEVTHADGFWFAFMQKGSNFSSQSWRGRSELPIDAIQDQYNENRLLTSITTDGSYWIAIFSEVTGCYSQRFGEVELNIPDDKPSYIGSGTGFAINSNGYIATNYHVIDGAKSVYVRGVNGDFEKTYKAKVIVEDQRNDLALLKIEKWLGEIPYKLNKSTIALANSVYALGYPLTSILGSDIKFTDGKIGATTGFNNDPTYYQHSAPIQPGNSGGPLFNESGDLIAINTLRVDQEVAITEGIFFSVKARYLANLLEDRNISFPKSRRLSFLSVPEQVNLIKKFVYLVETN